MTTSVSAMAHGRVVLAVKAQPFGVILFLAAAAIGLVSAAQVATGRNLLPILRPRVWWVAAGVIGLLAGWGAKALIGYLNGELPLR